MASKLGKSAEIIRNPRFKSLQIKWARAQNWFQLCEAVSRGVSVVAKHLRAMFSDLVALDFADPLELDIDA